jgi:hypothetical protein
LHAKGKNGRFDEFILCCVSNTYKFLLEINKLSTGYEQGYQQLINKLSTGLSTIGVDNFFIKSLFLKRPSILIVE